MSVVEKIPTGVPGLDILTHGGIPEGRSTLVVGRAGTGKTILGLQTLAHLAPRASRACCSRSRSLLKTSW